MQDIRVVVPCYNEGSRLSPTDFLRFAQANPSIKFYFVNDGSSDDTQSVLEKLCDKLKGQGKVIRLAKNSGKAEAVRQGLLAALQESAVDAVGYWDADLATPLEEIPMMLQVLDDRAHVTLVMGARVKLLGRDIQRRAVRHYLGRIFATVASNVLQLPVYDTQCGAKLLRASDEYVGKALATPFRTKWVFDVELIARLKNLHKQAASRNHFIFEYPLKRWHDVAGSKVKAWHFLLAGLDLWKIYRLNQAKP